MTGVAMVLVLLAVFSAVQISIFKALPRGVRKYLAYVPLLAIGLNFFGSFAILFFTGSAYFVGPINLMSSCIFAAYIVGYKSYRGIHKVQRGRFKFPGLAERHPEKHWFF